MPTLPTWAAWVPSGSARYNHVDICLAYNAVLCHAHASDSVMSLRVQ